MTQDSAPATLGETAELQPGDPHYTAYVGPPALYDFMGATQFRLLCALGLRAHHRLLDLGCGSLRAGRFFIAYLDPGHYHGIEPNPWLIREAIETRLGEDFVRINQPHFDENGDFRVPFDTRFDYVLAQSIFSHTGPDLARQAIRNLALALSDGGLIVANFLVDRRDSGESGWVYPGCVRFLPRTIERIADEANLVTTRLPWYHPNGLTWYLMAPKANPRRLPTPRLRRYLNGVVLNDPEFTESSLPRLFRGQHGLKALIRPRPARFHVPQAPRLGEILRLSADDGARPGGPRTTRRPRVPRNW